MWKSSILEMGKKQNLCSKMGSVINWLYASVLKSKRNWLNSAIGGQFQRLFSWEASGKIPSC